MALFVSEGRRGRNNSIEVFRFGGYQFHTFHTYFRAPSLSVLPRRQICALHRLALKYDDFWSKIWRTQTLVLVINLVVNLKSALNLEFQAWSHHCLSSPWSWEFFFLNFQCSNPAWVLSVKKTVLGLFCTDLAAPRPSWFQDLRADIITEWPLRVIDVLITWVPNYRYPMTKSGHPRDRAPITWPNWRAENKSRSIILL